MLRFAIMTAGGSVEPARQFVIWPLLDMVIFAAFFVPAIIYRRKPDIHKRFMIVATNESHRVQRSFRAIGIATPVLHLVFVLVWLSPIIIAMIYDFNRRRLVHPVYITGAIVLTVSSFRDAVVTTDIWLAFTQWLANAVA